VPPNEAKLTKISPFHQAQVNLPVPPHILNLAEPLYKQKKKKKHLMARMLKLIPLNPILQRGHSLRAKTRPWKMN
jgi:hypothetical protein